MSTFDSTKGLLPEVLTGHQLDGLLAELSGVNLPG